MLLNARRSQLCGLCIASLLAATPVLAQHGPPVPIAERGRGAAAVVVGAVENATSLYRTNRYGDNIIVSQLSVRVTEQLKGNTPGFVILEVDGGTVNGITMRTSDLPVLNPGDNVVFFLDQGPSGEYTPHLRGQGLLRLDKSGMVERSSLSLDEIRRQVRGAGR